MYFKNYNTIYKQVKNTIVLIKIPTDLAMRSHAAGVAAALRMLGRGGERREGRARF